MFMHSAKAFTAAKRITIGNLDAATASRAHPGGFLAATLVETALGWCPVGALREGMRVQTHDGGLCPITRLTRQGFSTGGAMLVHVPGGAIDNCDGLWLMPGQEILITSPVIEEVLDRAAARVEARHLAGFRGIGLRWLPGASEIVTLAFAQDEAVFANTGTLLHCRSGRADAGPDFHPAIDRAQAQAMLALIEDGALSSADLRLVA